MKLTLRALTLAAVTTVAGNAHAFEMTATLGAEMRAFAHGPWSAEQHGHNLSLSLEAELVHEWDGGRQVLAFVPFIRLDQGDGERSHADIRELTWVKAADAWELRLGIRKVFWGVAESNHLVDIINQTDLVENLDGEQKLGQPMANLALIGDWGTLDLFVLPYFRERTFPGASGRLRAPLPVATEDARYESDDEQRHIDYALRWSHSLGDYDIGLSHFVGTGREPTLTPGLDPNGDPALLPLYRQIRQTGIDLQATKGSWLWKFEAIRRSGQGDAFAAWVGGVEYTYFGVFDSAADLGVLAEYSRDERGARATTPFQDDVFVGFRLAMNDVQSSEVLAGVAVDRDTRSRFLNLEASRRLGENGKISLEARFFTHTEPGELLHGLRDDDLLQLELLRYF